MKHILTSSLYKLEPMMRRVQTVTDWFVPSGEKLPKATLEHYAVPCGMPPPSARIDPRNSMRRGQPMRIWNFWQYGLFLFTKATDITVALASHMLWGPRRATWGIEMTLINAFVRGAAQHSHLIDIHMVRRVMRLSGLIPLPSDALVTPVTFQVVSRDLRGFLAEHDQAEAGKRELSGEWVVGRETWMHLQGNDKGTGRVIYYIHGGAYYTGSATAQRLLTIPLAKYTESRVFVLDYRLAPETQFPGPFHDVVIGYMRLIEDLHIPPANIMIAGDSAGGALALALLMYLRDNAYPIPRAAVLMSPWVDKTMSCESWDTNASFDVIPGLSGLPDDEMNPIHLYLGEQMQNYITHPYVSPLFGNLKGLPPLLIQAGEAEVLRDEITLLARKAALAGVFVRHEVYEDAVHVFQAYPFLQTARRAFISCREFALERMPSGDSQILDKVKVNQEIHNDKATLVRGDGVETVSGIQDVTRELNTEESTFDGQAKWDFNSWGQAAGIQLPLSDNGEELLEQTVATSHNLRRARSAVQLINLIHAPPVITAPHRHRRTMSQSYHTPCSSSFSITPQRKMAIC